MQPLALTRQSRVIGGILLLTIVGVEFGGWFMTRIVTGAVEMTEFQQAFARAGHAHAGVLVTLGLVGLVMADVAALEGWLGWLSRLGIPAAAALMSTGFFVSSLGSATEEPNGLVVLLWLGAACLAAGVLSLGIGLLRSAASPRGARQREPIA